MATLPSSADRDAHQAQAARQFAAVGTGVRLVVGAALLALVLRTLVAEPFDVPSPSMLPALSVGDTLLVAKWPYGFGRYSAPVAIPGITGRIGGHLPQRGDVVVFKTPGDNRTDFIKRVIGLPGDRVSVTGGRVTLNGVTLPRVRTGDLIGSGSGCPAGQVCRFPQFIEQLGARHYAVLHVAANRIDDDLVAVIVPPGHYFVLGDNRDDSADSRLSLADGGVGMVPAANLIGRAEIIVMAVRHDRIGTRL